MESVSNDETFWASLHSTIVNYIDILLDESKIGVPDGWSTYEILEHLVVNDENLFRFLFREDDYRSFSFPKSVLVWSRRGFYSINTLTSRKGMMENSIGAGAATIDCSKVEVVSLSQLKGGFCQWLNGKGDGGRWAGYALSEETGALELR